MRTRCLSLAVLAHLALAACGGGLSSQEPGEPYRLSALVRTRLSSLEQEVGTPEDLPSLSPDEADDLEGLLEMAAGGDSQYVALAHDAISADFGPAAIPQLVQALYDVERTWQARSAAAGLLSTLDDPRGVEHLLAVLEAAPESWLRRHVAYHLSSTSSDRVVPRLLKRLKYENDHETFIWLAVSLGHFHNYSGLDALFDLGNRGGTAELRTLATSQLEYLAEEVGLSPDELHRRWSSVDADSLPRAMPSLGLRLEAWRLVAAMSDDTIQLRGVDDARFVLSRLGPWAALELADALGDEDFHVRLHTAQVLERMGPRAQGSGPALLNALSEPLLAPSAAEALGRVGFPGAAVALEEATSGRCPHELRVASVRALGRLGLPDSIPAVTLIFKGEDEPQDLRMAAATALVLLTEGDEVATWLRDTLAGTSGDGPAAELALETWLVRGAQQGRTGFEEALGSWLAELAAPPGVTPTLQQLGERRSRRSQGLGLGALTGN